MKILSYKYQWLILVSVLGLISCSRMLYSEDNIAIQPTKSCEAFTCVTEVDSLVQKKLAKQDKRMLQIYLIRHAKPNVKKKLFYSAQEAQQYVYDYNSVPVVPFSKDKVHVHLKSNHVIYCSNLPRSQETALKIFGEKYPVIADTVFREYEIKMIKANSLIKLPLPIWQAFSRGSWMLGFNHRGIESHKQAKKRVKLATQNLIQVANKEETAVLVAHGMLNSGIEKELKRQSWQVIQKRGQVNLGATVLVKIVNIRKKNKQFENNSSK